MNVTDLESHIDAGAHSTINAHSSMDQVKSGFVRRMKGSISNHTSGTHGQCSKSLLGMNDVCKEVEEMSQFGKEGWALPVRSNFRFTPLQKQLLYEIFIKGEKDGKKSTAEQSSLLIRKKLRPDEYVTPKQIKSLFSRWSRLYREGRLKDPKGDTGCNSRGEKSDDEFEDEDYGDDDNLMINEEIQQEARDISDVISSTVYHEDQWVAIKFGLEWYPGQICNVSLVLIQILKTILTPFLSTVRESHMLYY